MSTTPDTHLQAAALEAAAQAQAARAALWPALEALALAAPARRGAPAFKPGQGAALLARAALFDNAHWWLHWSGTTASRALREMLFAEGREYTPGEEPPFFAARRTADQLPALVGETAEIIAQAEAKRERIMPLLPAVVAYTTNGFAATPAEQAACLRRIRRANSAAWWLKIDDKDEEQLFWSCANMMMRGSAAGSWLPANFYSAEAVAKRSQTSAAAAEQAKFLNLPALTGSAKQTAWAETLRAKFIDECSDVDAQAVQDVLALTDAATARFWIDMSKWEGNSWQNPHAPQAMFEHMARSGWAQSSC